MNFAGKSVFAVPKEQHSQESASDKTAKGGNLEKPALAAGAEGASAVTGANLSGKRTEFSYPHHGESNLSDRAFHTESPILFNLIEATG